MRQVSVVLGRLCLVCVLLAGAAGVASARGPIDAAMDWGNKALFFMGPMVTVYDKALDAADPGYPAPIGQHFAPPGVWGWDGEYDAAVDWGNGKAYIFKGGEYIRFDIRSSRCDPGYPKRITPETWPGVWPEGVDAVINWGNGKAYFFKGQEYIRYDIKADHVDPGYPKWIIPETWPGLWPSGVDAAVNWGNGKAYFFRGGEYIRYDIRADRADPGYPKRITPDTWTGLLR